MTKAKHERREPANSRIWLPVLGAISALARLATLVADLLSRHY